MGIRSEQESTVAERREVLSGPPLSIGRLRHNSARDPGVRWRGVGLTALVGKLGLGEGISPRYVRAGDLELAGMPRSVLDLFAAGGTEVVLVDESRAAVEDRTGADSGTDASGSSASERSASERSGWTGEDGGPGRRTGIYQLLDLQDVSVIALAEVSTEARRNDVFRLAGTRPDKLFVLAESRPGSELERVAENVLLVRGRKLEHVPQVGLVCALLRACDFTDESVQRVRWAPEERSALARWRQSDAWRGGEAWRRREGLRRSIELGTRWVVLEHHRPLVWRRVEREVRGFLYRMAELGLVRSPRRTPFEVKCGPVDGPSARVAVRVRARLTDPWEGALSSAGGVSETSGDQGSRRGVSVAPASAGRAEIERESPHPETEEPGESRPPEEGEKSPRKEDS